MDTKMGEPVWLSGGIQTFLNKIVFPIIWAAIAIGALLWSLATNGRISIAREFYFICAFFVVASVLLVRLAARTHMVGYAGRELVVSDYVREARIPFDQVESVDNVWWYRGQLVRIVFRGQTPFGQTIYYLPKWGPLRWFFSSPEKELREIIAG